LATFYATSVAHPQTHTLLLAFNGNVHAFSLSQLFGLAKTVDDEAWQSFFMEPRGQRIKNPFGRH